MKEDYKKEFARILSGVINARGIKKAWLAEMMGIEKSCVSKWTSGVTAPGYNSLIKLARVLDVSVADLFPKIKRGKR